MLCRLFRSIKSCVQSRVFKVTLPSYRPILSIRNLYFITIQAIRKCLRTKLDNGNNTNLSWEQNIISGYQVAQGFLLF